MNRRELREFEERNGITSVATRDRTVLLVALGTALAMVAAWAVFSLPRATADGGAVTVNQGAAGKMGAWPVTLAGQAPRTDAGYAQTVMVSPAGTPTGTTTNPQITEPVGATGLPFTQSSSGAMLTGVLVSGFTYGVLVTGVAADVTLGVAHDGVAIQNRSAASIFCSLGAPASAAAPDAGAWLIGVGGWEIPATSGTLSYDTTLPVYCAAATGQTAPLNTRIILGGR